MHRPAKLTKLMETKTEAKETEFVKDAEWPDD